MNKKKEKLYIDRFGSIFHNQTPTMVVTSPFVKFVLYKDELDISYLFKVYKISRSEISSINYSLFSVEIEYFSDGKLQKISILASTSSSLFNVLRQWQDNNIITCGFGMYVRYFIILPLEFCCVSYLFLFFLSRFLLEISILDIKYIPSNSGLYFAILGLIFGIYLGCSYLRVVRGYQNSTQNTEG